MIFSKKILLLTTGIFLIIGLTIVFTLTNKNDKQLSTSSKNLSGSINYTENKYNKNEPEFNNTKNNQEKNILGELSKNAEIEFRKNEEKKQKKLNEFIKNIKEYAELINSNNLVLQKISEESINNIKKQSVNMYSLFNDKEKELFKNDLSSIGFDIKKDFDLRNDKDFKEYLDFIIKYPVKSLGKIIEIKDIDGKYDEKSDIFCGTYNYVFEGNKTLKIESLCMNNKGKFLIHK